MNVITGIALVLLTLVGYSIGRNLFASQYKISPIVLDLPLCLIIWVGAFSVPLPFEKGWKILVWVVIAILAGLIFTSLAPKKEDKPKYKTTTPETKIQNPGLWAQWKKFAAKMGDFQARLMLMWFYFIIITPYGILVHIFSDPLFRKPPVASAWLDRSPSKTDLDNTRRQF